MRRAHAQIGGAEMCPHDRPELRHAFERDDGQVPASLVEVHHESQPGARLAAELRRRSSAGRRVRPVRPWLPPWPATGRRDPPVSFLGRAAAQGRMRSVAVVLAGNRDDLVGHRVFGVTSEISPPFRDSVGKSLDLPPFSTYRRTGENGGRCRSGFLISATWGPAYAVWSWHCCTDGAAGGMRPGEILVPCRPLAGSSCVAGMATGNPSAAMPPNSRKSRRQWGRRKGHAKGPRRRLAPVGQDGRPQHGLR